MYSLVNGSEIRNFEYITRWVYFLVLLLLAMQAMNKYEYTHIRRLQASILWHAAPTRMRRYSLDDRQHTARTPAYTTTTITHYYYYCTAALLAQRDNILISTAPKKLTPFLVG